LLERARAEIRRSWREVCELNNDHPQASELFNPDKLPALHDPFAGGGAIPLEAQRLGLEAYASDLNAVAVLINKAMIEIPPKFAGRPPVSLVQKRKGTQDDLGLGRSWPGAMGLAEDVRYYGAWICEEARKRIGSFYPPVRITAEMALTRPDLKSLVGQDLTVIAWLWALSVKSPNPAFSHVDAPLVSTFVLSRKAGKEVYVQPVIKGDRYRFVVRIGKPPPQADAGTKAAGANFRCLVSDTSISGDYIKAEAQAGRMGRCLMAIACDGPRGRVYLEPIEGAEALANTAMPTWKPDVEFFQKALGFRVGNYGMTKWSDLFTPRQLVAMTTFSDLVCDVRERIRKDAIARGHCDDGRPLDQSGNGVTAYAEAISLYLAFAVDKMADLGNRLVRWEPVAQCPRQLFGKQAIPMMWGFAEANSLGDSSGSWTILIDGLAKALAKVFQQVKPWFRGFAIQADAQTQTVSKNKFISSDPPYYDNIGYADLSDFFYVWLRRSLRSVYPDLLATIAVPKTEELVATPIRNGDRAEAEVFF
jgi:putative DNA methylase